MAFIKAQRLILDDNGVVISGSASIIDTEYGKFGTYHAKHTVRERLGKVIWLSADKKDGIFLSPTRGLIEYCAKNDTFSPVVNDDPRLKNTNVFPRPQVHTVFGDVFLLLEFFRKTGLIKVLHTAFSEKSDYERVLCHILHGVLRDGSRISCANFILK